MITLRPDQQIVLDQTRELVKRGLRPCMVAPCGWGKGTTFSKMVQAAIEREKSTLFLINNCEILRDFSRRLDRIGIDHGVIQANHPRYRPWLRAQVATIQTLHRREKLPKADLILLDEAHFATSATFRSVLERYRGVPLVGATATPQGPNGMGLNGIFDEFVFGPSTWELIELGLLVPVRAYAPPPPDLSGIKITAGEYNQKQAAEVMDKPKLVGDSLEHWLRLAQGRPTVGFAAGVEHSKHLRDAFVAAGIKAEHADAKTPADVRDALWEDLAKGKVQVAWNVGLATYGWDVPPVSCVILERPTESLTLFRQMTGRGQRPYPGKTDCIARGTRVLTEKGLIPIENITTHDRVWDGHSFVTHKGAICKGDQHVITYAGLTATPDHRVKTAYGWLPFAYCARKKFRIIKTGSGGVAIREHQGCFSGDPTPGQAGKPQGHGRLRMPRLRQQDIHPINQLARWPHKRVPTLQSARSISEMVVRPRAANAAAMYKSEKFSLSRLRWSRDRISLHISHGSRALDTRQLRGTRRSKPANRPGQQRGSLRAWKSTLGHSTTEPCQQSSNQENTTDAQIQVGLSSRKIRRRHAGASVRTGTNSRTNRGTMGDAIVQTKREVWDLLDCGPGHCFTAEDLLVHNCVLLDHAGAVHRHGLIEDDPEWTLEGNCGKKRGADYDPALAVRMCPECWAAFRSTETVCPSCGWVYVPKRAEIKTVAGELQEITESVVAAKPYVIKKLSPDPMHAHFQREAERLQKSHRWAWKMADLGRKGEIYVNSDVFRAWQEFERRGGRGAA